MSFDRQYLLNETFAVDAKIARQWVSFMNMHCMPLIKEAAICKSHIFSQVAHGDNEGALSFAIQILFDTKDDLHSYDMHLSPRINQKISTTFAGKYASFRTVLEVINRS